MHPAPLQGTTSVETPESALSPVCRELGWDGEASYHSVTTHPPNTRPLAAPVSPGLRLMAVMLTVLHGPLQAAGVQT